MGDTSPSYLLWEPERPSGVPSRPPALRRLGVGPPIEYDNRLPSKTAPYTAKNVARSAPMPNPSVVPVMKSSIVPMPLCGR